MTALPGIGPQRPSGTPQAFSSLPPEQPIAMPEQDFRAAPERIEAPRSDLGSNIDAIAKRVLVLALALLPALLAAHEMKRTIGLDGFSGWEIAYLALFVPLFAWIAFGCATSVIGFLIMSGDGSRVQPYRPARPRPVAGRTAVLLPVCNEDFLAVMGRLSIMERSLSRVMGGDRFDFFILSDSNPENGEIEAETYRQMHAGFTRPVYYRRRAVNLHRKPGNIADWVTRFGGAYDYMIVLDADSVMGGQTMARLAVDMECHPHLGLIQTVPSVVGASTLFARWQQFANRLYGPIGAAGMIWWARSEGTFWGHNAIIRVKAFAESCGLPTLRGPAPFGGHIMSHDMVEASLLRRRGWAVHMVMAEDSYEEFPPSIPDLAVRDRRWCQGNIQHVPLMLRTTGLHLVNRFQLLVGASAYLTSPMWLALMLVVLVGQAQGAWTATQVLPSGDLLALTVALLFGPKFLALFWALSNPARREAFGGAKAATWSVLAECALSIMLAPVAMLTQTINLFGILIGRKSAWNGQTRDRDGMSMGQAVWIFKYHIALGAAFVALAVYGGMSLGWMSPVIAGLFCAPALAALTARKDLGRRADERGLFRVPEPWWKTQKAILREAALPVARGATLAHAPQQAAALAANDA
ncbi:MAG: glucans biosynthesis glucosyltransferase MdoH [Sphingobium sp.]|nr:MAG: glucans biosynthesis glucosyltransferase MdoH [Sphingobium sp.]